MSDEPKYPVKGNVEWLTEQGLVEQLKNFETLKSVFSIAGADMNIRRAKDTTTAHRQPGVFVDAMAEQTIPRTNEYEIRIIITCETQKDTDKDGQLVHALVGAVRDFLHIDRSEDGFKGDCEGALEALNETNRDIVYHQVHEVNPLGEDDAGRTLRRLVTVHAWGYPGIAVE